MFPPRVEPRRGRDARRGLSSSWGLLALSKLVAHGGSSYERGTANRTDCRHATVESRGSNHEADDPTTGSRVRIWCCPVWNSRNTIISGLRPQPNKQGRIAT